MKENNGHAARQKVLKKKLGIVLVIFFCAIGGLVTVEKERYNSSSNSNSNNNYREVGRRQSIFTNLIRTGRKPKPWFPRIIRPLSSSSSYSSTESIVKQKIDDQSSLAYYNRNNIKKWEEYKDLLSAELNLIDIDINYHEMRQQQQQQQQNVNDNENDDHSYEGVYGVFCKLNWSYYKNDPSSVPMFRFLVAASRRCHRTTMRVPLKEIAILARSMDQQNNRQPTDAMVPKPLNFTGIVFHESRCGSTLVANTLIAMDPTRHRVYSESPPPITAMKCVIDEKCTVDQAAAILRDVLYLMGRSNDPKEERVFFKIQSIGSRHIDVFRRAFPTTPFIFVYREPVQVMMSHLAVGTQRANCLRSYQLPPRVTQELLKRHGYYSATQLSPQEFCAAHLATITENALANLEQSPDYGIAVNYNSLPQSMYQTILPEKLGVPVGQEEIDRIIKIAGMYSKGKGDRKGMAWRDDSERKEETADDEIREAAHRFMQESYDALQEFAV